jgi:hypothetical protein
MRFRGRAIAKSKSQKSRLNLGMRCKTAAGSGSAGGPDAGIPVSSGVVTAMPASVCLSCGPGGNQAPGTVRVGGSCLFFSRGIVHDLDERNLIKARHECRRRRSLWSMPGLLQA